MPVQRSHGWKYSRLCRLVGYLSIILTKSNLAHDGTYLLVSNLYFCSAFNFFSLKSSFFLPATHISQDVNNFWEFIIVLIFLLHSTLYICLNMNRQFYRIRLLIYAGPPLEKK